MIWQWREAVYQRGVNGRGADSTGGDGAETELARDKEAASARWPSRRRAQEAIARKAADDQRAIAVGALASAERSLYFNNIDLADHEWTANNIGHVDQLLAASPANSEELGVELPEPAGAHGRWRRSPPGAEAFSGWSVSADGSSATIVNADLVASAWDLRSHRRLRSVKLEGPPPTEIASTALSRDGRIFAASVQRIGKGAIASEGAVWDITTGRLLWKLPQPALQTYASYTALSLNSDGTRLMSSSLSRRRYLQTSRR